MGRSVPRSSPKPRSGLCPELLADFRIPNLLGARRGAEGSFLCSLSSRFSGRGGGVGSLPRAWRRVGVPPAASVLKKFVRLASTFPSPPFGSSDFAGPRRPRLYGFHTGTRSLSNRKGRGRRRGGREREPRIPKPPGCSQGAQRAVFCAVRVADLPAASVLKKFVRLASAFPSPPFGSSDFAGPRRPRLYGFHTGTRSLSNRKGRSEGRRVGEE